MNAGINFFLIMGMFFREASTLRSPPTTISHFLYATSEKLPSPFLISLRHSMELRSRAAGKNSCFWFCSRTDFQLPAPSLRVCRFWPACRPRCSFRGAPRRNPARFLSSSATTSVLLLLRLLMSHLFPFLQALRRDDSWRRCRCPTRPGRVFGHTGRPRKAGICFNSLIQLHLNT